MAGTWSATKRPKLDLDFADAFASQMMALKRQQLAMQAEQQKSDNKARELADTAKIKREQDVSDATLAHTRSQENINLQRKLTNDAAIAEEGRKQKADADAIEARATGTEKAMRKAGIFTEKVIQTTVAGIRAGRQVDEEPKVKDITPPRLENRLVKGKYHQFQYNPDGTSEDLGEIPDKEVAPRDPNLDLQTQLNIRNAARQIAADEVSGALTAKEQKILAFDPATATKEQKKAQRELRAVIEQRIVARVKELVAAPGSDETYIPGGDAVAEEAQPQGAAPTPATDEEVAAAFAAASGDPVKARAFLLTLNKTAD